MKSLNKLEEKFNIANNLVEELSSVVEDLEFDNLPDLVSSPNEITLPQDTPVEVFSLDTLKSDFMLVRNNIIKLINTGQRILDAASVVDVSDLKASQLQALSDLQSTLGNNLKMLISTYKEIADIETSRNKAGIKTQEGISNVNTGTITNNNIVFSGSSDELLNLIKQNQ